jgi:hypothetical protein
MSEYLDRTAVALASEHTISTGLDTTLGDIDPGWVIRIAGNGKLYDDIALQPNNPNKQHGPSSSVYLVADFANDCADFVAFKSIPADNQVATNELELLKASVDQMVLPYNRLGIRLCATAIKATLLFTDPNINAKLLITGAEYRKNPDGSAYAAILVPSLFRKTPQAMTRYIDGLKKDGQSETVTDEMLTIAYGNDPRLTSKIMSLSIMVSVLEQYEEIASFRRMME